MELKSKKNWLKYYEYIKQENRWVAVVVLFLTGLKLLSEFVARLNYELSGPFNWDTSLYWAVGKGWLNGLPPYAALFENKPPGIFLISAFSLLFSPDLLIGNILQAIVLCIVALAPVLYLARSGLSVKKIDSAKYYFLALAFGLLLGLYTAERSGEIQVESFGAAFISLYIVSLANRKQLLLKKTGRTYLYFLGLASLSLLFGIGMKEPFLATALAAALILTDNLDDFTGSFLIPLAVALLGGLLVLLFTRLLIPYLTIYLPFMLNNHITAHGHPLSRAWDYRRLFHDLNMFTSPFGTLIFIQAGVYLSIELLKAKKQANISRIFLVVIKFVSIVFLTLFSIGLGGHFFNHHFIFAIPVFLGFFVYILKNLNMLSPYQQRLFTVFTLVFIGLGAFLLPDANYKQRIDDVQHTAEILKKEAEYVDLILDIKDLDRYLFLGRNGPHLYTYTRHSPFGPLFFQYPEWTESNYFGFKDKLLRNLREADLVVFDSFTVGKYQEEILKYLQENFTLRPWPEVSHLQRGEKKYQILFRKTAPPAQNR